MWTEPEWLDEDTAIKELTQVTDADELCRRLLESQRGWGTSTRYAEAVDLLSRVHGTGTLPDALVALLLCTCDRWYRVTAKLIAALEDSGLLTSADLDELAESLLGEEVVMEHPLVWVSPEWLGVDVSDGTAQEMTVDEHTMATTRLRPEPPLRRWAAARALRGYPGRFHELLTTAESFQPRHRDALLHGLLDAAGAVEVGDRRRLVKRGLRAGTAPVRRTALDRLCELDGPAAARRRAAADTNRRVRDWRPPTTPPPTTPPPT